jgi:hypothetical protein
MMLATFAMGAAEFWLRGRMTKRMSYVKTDDFLKAGHLSCRSALSKTSMTLDQLSPTTMGGSGTDCC